MVERVQTIARRFEIEQLDGEGGGAPAIAGAEVGGAGGHRRDQVARGAQVDVVAGTREWLSMRGEPSSATARS